MIVDPETHARITLHVAEAARLARILAEQVAKLEVRIEYFHDKRIDADINGDAARSGMLNDKLIAIGSQSHSIRMLVGTLDHYATSMTQRVLEYPTAD